MTAVTSAPRLHRDRTVSFWSKLESRWVERAFYVSAEELELMAEQDRARIEKHLGLES